MPEHNTPIDERPATRSEATDGPSRDAAALARGVMRFLADFGYQSLAEFRLRNGRRADVLALNRDGHVVVVEIKTSETDFRVDGKWPEYLPFCDAFYFAVPPGFPEHILPGEHGLMRADPYHAEIVRPAPEAKLNGTRRRHLTLRFALVAAARLQGFEDPRI
jgi:hypothetical protein